VPATFYAERVEDTFANHQQEIQSARSILLSLVFTTINSKCRFLVVFLLSLLILDVLLLVVFLLVYTEYFIIPNRMITLLPNGS